MSFSPANLVLGPDGRPLDVIELERLQVECIVGVYPSERDAPQPLELDVALYLDTRAAARGGHLADSVNYARLCGELRFLLESCRFGLLESAAEALCAYVLAPPTADAPHAQVQAVTLRLTKPHALVGQTVPRLQVHRTAREVTYGREEKPFGRVDVVYEQGGCGVYRLRIRPGGTIPTHVHQAMEESELVLGAGLLLQGRPVQRGQAFRWPRGLPHRYDNPSATEQTVLCVDRPAFVPDDEVEVPEPPGGLAPVQGVAYYPREDGASESGEGPRA